VNAIPDHAALPAVVHEDSALEIVVNVVIFHQGSSILFDFHPFQRIPEDLVATKVPFAAIVNEDAALAPIEDVVVLNEGICP